MIAQGISRGTADEFAIRTSERAMYIVERAYEMAAAAERRIWTLRLFITTHIHRPKSAVYAPDGKISDMEPEEAKYDRE